MLVMLLLLLMMIMMIAKNKNNSLIALDYILLHHNLFFGILFILFDFSFCIGKYQSCLQIGRNPYILQFVSTTIPFSHYSQVIVYGASLSVFTLSQTFPFPLTVGKHCRDIFVPVSGKIKATIVNVDSQLLSQTS